MKSTDPRLHQTGSGFPSTQASSGNANRPKREVRNGVGRTNYGAPIKRYQGTKERRRVGKYPNKFGNAGSHENGNDKTSTSDAPTRQNEQIPKTGQGRS